MVIKYKVIEKRDNLGTCVPCAYISIKMFNDCVKKLAPELRIDGIKCYVNTATGPLKINYTNIRRDMYIVLQLRPDNLI